MFYSYHYANINTKSNFVNLMVPHLNTNNAQMVMVFRENLL